LSDGLALIQGLLEHYWETVHPQLDAADDNDPTLRINTLASLCDPDTVLHSVREAILVNSAAFGRLSLRDILISSGRLSLPASSNEQPIEISTINGAFMDAELDQLQSTADAIRRSIASFATIESLLMDKVGAMQMADFSTLPDLLKEAQQIMSEHLTQRGVGETEMTSEVVAEGTGSPTVSQPVTGEINSREDAIRMLDMVTDYFKRHEPSSPVPLLLQRAKRLVAKDFMEILRDLTPDGVKQAEEISGVFTQKQ
jgi:type VI secretion system protein ImpA